MRDHAFTSRKIDAEFHSKNRRRANTAGGASKAPPGAPKSTDSVTESARSAVAGRVGQGAGRRVHRLPPPAFGGGRACLLHSGDWLATQPTHHGASPGEPQVIPARVLGR